VLPDLLDLDLELLSVLDIFVSIFTCGVVLDKQPTLENLVLLLAVIIVPVGGCPSHSPVKAIHHFFVTMQKMAPNPATGILLGICMNGREEWRLSTRRETDTNNSYTMNEESSRVTLNYDGLAILSSS
jgi:hypothetical protein